MAEGKGYSEMYRNTSEELFLKSLMENSAPTLDMLGFKNISSQLHHHHHHNFRIDSEELFKTWLTNGENHDHNSSSIAHRTRQASRRISSELSNLASQQPLQNKSNNDADYPVPESPSADLYHQSIGNSMENVVQTSSLNFAKAWFHSSQPMTRSRSSELRKRYVSMQNAQVVSERDFRERIIENLKDGRKRGGLVRHGSITSNNSGDNGDQTKKRRVERSRNAEWQRQRKEIQRLRCENLEKEVRSLKLNLSFMNRKDSEQTKQIEELQKYNEDLADEKERLLQEIERILSEAGKM